MNGERLIGGQALPIIDLFAAAVVSLFAIGAGVMLLLRWSDWQIGFLAGLAVFAAAWVASNHILYIFETLNNNIASFGQYEHAFPTLVLSTLVLGAIFFLERIVKGRIETQKNMRLAKRILDRTKIPVLWLEQDGGVHYANNGAQEFLRYSRNELLSKSIREIAPLYLPDNWRRDWIRLREHGSTSIELHCIRSDGQLIPVDVTVIYIQSREIELGCLFIRDITDKKRAEADLRTAMAKVEHANQCKTEFLANMSHELRTPLNSINGFSEIIMNESFGPMGNDRYRDYACDIHASGQHLLNLINDILDLSKVESGIDELREEEVTPSKLISNVINLLKERARRANVELELEVADDTPGLWADERKVKQIMINLISNSVKFTPSGGKVSIKAWASPGSGYVFQVIDNGIGIAINDIPKALSPFQQIDSALNRRYDGTGLGLPLAKKLVELHGGYLDLQSQVNIGTTVTIRFPAERVMDSSYQTKNVDMAKKVAF